MYADLRRALANAPDFCDGGPGVVEEAWIVAAEQALGHPLPSSYRWWLAHCGCGGFDGSPLYTLAPPEFCADADSDIVTMAAINLRNGLGAPGRLYFFEPDGDERYFFDLTRRDADGDHPVVVEDLTEGELRDYDGVPRVGELPPVMVESTHVLRSAQCENL